MEYFVVDDTYDDSGLFRQMWRHVDADLNGFQVTVRRWYRSTDEGERFLSSMNLSLTVLECSSKHTHSVGFEGFMDEEALQEEYDRLTDLITALDEARAVIQSHMDDLGTPDSPNLEELQADNL